MSVPVRGAIEALPAYRPGRNAADLARELGLPSAIKLASNELAYGLLPGVADALTRAATDSNRYPDNGAEALTAELAARFGVSVDQVAVGCGSVSLCQQLVQAYTGPGDEVIFGWRSFEAYPLLVTVAGSTPVTVPLREHTHDPQAMLAAVTERTRLMFVCNPNNPTGTALRTADLVALLDAVPEHVLVVLDEAYREFVTDPDVPDGAGLLAGRGNLCLLRTFSKAYGLAALRVGYLIAEDPAVASATRKTFVPFSVSSTAQAAALAALAAEGEMRRRCAEVVTERDRVTAGLTELGLPTPDSQANFLWLPMGEQAAAFGAFGESRGVIVRPFAGDGVRVSTGTPQENDAFLATVAEWARNTPDQPAAGA